MSNNNPKIIVKNLNVYYDTLHVLHDINIEIPDKQITAIIGPSGCGKTTLLKSINRLVELNHGVKTTGNISLDGDDIYQSNFDVIELRKRVGLIGQTPSPLPMSISDNIAYGMKIHGYQKKDIIEKIEGCLKIVGLWDEVYDRLDEPAQKLSVGQQQRLSLARTLAIDPEVLLCDEPTSALDPISSKNIELLLKILKERFTIILVTHTLRQAKRIGDFIIFMYLGEIIECGPVDTFFIKPKNDQTKKYLKGMFG